MSSAYDTDVVYGIHDALRAAMRRTEATVGCVSALPTVCFITMTVYQVPSGIQTPVLFGLCAVSVLAMLRTDEIRRVWLRYLLDARYPDAESRYPTEYLIAAAMM